MFVQKKLHIHPIMEVVQFTLAPPLSQKKEKSMYMYMYTTVLLY